MLYCVVTTWCICFFYCGGYGLGKLKRYWACSWRSESHSKSRFGSRSASWLGSWFELRAFTSFANADPITNRICALWDNILVLLRRLTHAWLQRTFPKCARTNHIPKELCVQQVLRIRLSRSITVQNALFFAFQKPDLKELCVHKG